MGYDLLTRQPGQSIADFFALAWSKLGVAKDIIDQEIIETCDAEIPWVVCTIEQTERGSNEGKVYLIREQFHFEVDEMLGIKEIAESEIPFFTGFPPRLLMQLPETLDGETLQWREHCWRTWYQALQDAHSPEL